MSSKVNYSRLSYEGICLIFQFSLGTYDSERVKQGAGVYIWMGPTSEEDETLVEKSRYEGNYKDGLRHGVGKMKYPSGDVYEGEFFENKVCLRIINTSPLTYSSSSSFS